MRQQFPFSPQSFTEVTGQSWLQVWLRQVSQNEIHRVYYYIMDLLLGSSLSIWSENRKGTSLKWHLQSQKHKEMTMSEDKGKQLRSWKQNYWYFYLKWTEALPGQRHIGGSQSHGQTIVCVKHVVHNISILMPELSQEPRSHLSHSLFRFLSVLWWHNIDVFLQYFY